ncbi:hypothetical protein [Streptomyces griseoaurantiacus]|uniref:Uncharacterized protein n=1 Tax=Streptomyces griseoaurantiacus TaxID=68213 RepID=A0A7W2HUP1_9ACTN|nr:hypothetical protein [Streptomyces griseoaurantiacus]MBA5222233.1 hypothetical protein [Streptomyces griseoaurantiacus]
MAVFVLLLIAVILLVLAALNVPSPRLNLMCLGLAFFAASFLYTAGQHLT